MVLLSFHIADIHTITKKMFEVACKIVIISYTPLYLDYNIV